MELYHLRTFLAVAEAGHLTRAAEVLCISQPAVSAHVKALEAELGLDLFERTPRGMTLTPAGAALLDEARQVFGAVDAFKRKAGGLRDELIGAVRIGLNTDAAFLRVAALQQCLRARHPRLEVEFLSGTTGANLPKLRQGRLDACFMSGPVDAAEFDSRLLGEEEMAIAAPLAWRDRLGDTSVAALAQLPWIHNSPDRIQHRVMAQLFESLPALPRRAAMANQKDAVLALVAAETGLAITRRKDIEEAAQRRPLLAIPLPLDAPAPTVSLRFAWLARRGEEAPVRAVVAAIEEVWALDGHESAATADER